MAVDVRSRALRIVDPNNDTSLDLLPIQGLWTDKHQAISQLIFLALLAFVQPMGGKVQYAPLRLQVRAGKHREPDILLVRNANDPRRQNRYWLGADLVVEIVSPDDRERDTKIKRADYAEAGIPEYWIIGPQDETIIVLSLAGDSYTEHGVFHRGEIATSALLNGFIVSVDAALDVD